MKHLMQSTLRSQKEEHSKQESDFKDEHEYVLSLYKKVVTEKDLFEQKYVEAVR